MLNNFCFHVYAQKSLFKDENVNDFFLDLLLLTTRSTDIRVHRAGSQLKIWAFRVISKMPGGWQVVTYHISFPSSYFPSYSMLLHVFMKFVLIVRLNRVKTWLGSPNPCVSCVWVYFYFCLRWNVIRVKIFTSLLWLQWGKALVPNKGGGLFDNVQRIELWYYYIVLMLAQPRGIVNIGKKP